MDVNNEATPSLSSKLAVFCVCLVLPFSLVVGTPSFICFSIYHSMITGSIGVSSMLSVALVLWTALDNSTPSHGGRPLPGLWRVLQRWCGIPLWDYFRAYFPSNVDTPPKLLDSAEGARPTLICVHPHGIWGCATWSNLFLGTGGMPPELAALQPRTVTIGGNFLVPLWRDYLLSLGLISADVHSISHVLSHQGCVVLLPGGATEALYAHPGDTYTLVLRRRKGYARLALQHGARLVPVINFGEINLYHQASSPWLTKIQRSFKSLTGVAVPLLQGTGLFGERWGLLPRARPLHTVFGPPIDVPQCEAPTPADIQEVKDRYITSLQALFDQHRDRLHPGARLVIT